MNFKATKAWADKTHARLGQKQPKNWLWSGPEEKNGPVTKPAAWILKQRRLGPAFSPPAWASFSPTCVSRSSEIDSWVRLSVEQNYGAAAARNPSSFVFSVASVSTRDSKRGGRRGDRPEERRRRASARRWATLTRGWARRRRVVALWRPNPGARAGQP
jgi:hypothetical protein